MTPDVANPASSQARTVESLTVLRGLAAYGVVLTHCLRLIEASGAAAAPLVLRWLDLGEFSVIVFFCLSGYTLLLAHRADRWDGPGLGRFFIRRLFRVYPAFLVSFAVCVVAVLGLRSAGDLTAGNWVGDNNRLPDSAVTLAYLSLTSNLFGIDGYVNNVFWSLPIEFQFYLLFPLLLVLLRRSPWVLLAGVVALFGAGRALHLPGQTATLAWIFAGGMGAAWFFSRTRGPNAAPIAVALAALLGGCILADLPPAIRHHLPGPLDFYFGVLAIALVAAVARIELTSTRETLTRALLFQGEISYSIYLFHTPPILLAYALLERWRLQGPAALALVYGLVFSFTWVLAYLVHGAVERPGIALGRRLSAAGRGPNGLARSRKQELQPHADHPSP